MVKLQTDYSKTVAAPGDEVVFNQSGDLVSGIVIRIERRSRYGGEQDVYIIKAYDEWGRESHKESQVWNAGSIYNLQPLIDQMDGG